MSDRRSRGPRAEGAKGPVAFPEHLPISAHVRELAQAIHDHPVVVVAGETGSGKTTQLPKIALAMGRGLSSRIGVTQPRRIAATSVAARVAEELGVELGREVGYQIRFNNRSGPETYVKFMTDGILLAETQADPLLRAYDTIILDEAHERSLNIDFLLGWCKRILPKRPDLRVVVSSATLETERFSSFFNGAPVVRVSGRTFPVEVIHRPPHDDEGDLAETIANVVEEITEIDPRSDVLVFLPGEREIHEAMAALTDHALPRTALLPLYGRLSQGDQGRVFSPLSERKIVLATNVAETSLTIPGIVYVIDAGLARVNRYQPRSGVTQLLIEPVSRASADQRKGRAGRVQSGVCFRLYDEADEAARPDYTDPEILRVGLAGAILQMKSLGLGDLREFPFLDAPPKRAVDEGYRVLEELGALDDDGRLSAIGKKLARLPVDPRIGRMILAGEEEGALREVLVIAAALGVQDPRERPLQAQSKADQAHRRFADERSDFLALLRLWRHYHVETRGKTQRQVRKLCSDGFLSYLRMREWSDVHDQLNALARDLGLQLNSAPADEDAIARALLPGLLSRVGMWHPESRTYLGARQTRFVLHPSSALAKKPPQWVIVSELVETSRLFGRTAAAIDPAWLERAGGALCKRSYGEPHWVEKSAQVTASEQVSLYGLPIVQGKRVHYGPIAPREARRVFLTHALARGEWNPRPTPPFLTHNRAVLEQARAMRDRARRSDLVADEDALVTFFEQRVPDDVYSGKTFEAFRAEAEARDARALFLSLDDVLLDEAKELGPSRFPESMTLGGAKLPLRYRFDPGEDDDGVSVDVPVALVPQLDPGALEWPIPAWRADKIALLCHALPKSVQRTLGDIEALAHDLARELSPETGPLLDSMTRAIERRTGVRLPPGSLRPDELPPHLRLYVRVVSDGKILGAGREIAELRERFGARGRDEFATLPKDRFERDGLIGFPQEGLPESVRIAKAGTAMLGYPALVEEGQSVHLRVLESLDAACTATRVGLRRLLLMNSSTTLQAIEKQVPARLGASPGWKASPPARTQIALRAIDEAYELTDPARWPRTAADYRDRLQHGRGRVSVVVAELSKLALEALVEYDAAEAQLRGLAGKPGALPAALDDVRTQLAHLAPPDWFLATPRDRLKQLPRYCKAIRVRLDRLPNGPQKDQSKAAAVLPYWKQWLDGKANLAKRGVSPEAIDAFHWLIEEWRIATFAPEIGPTVSLSAKKLDEAWVRLVKG